jgi:hypothetical protein
VDLSEGFQIEDPEILVRWGITESELLALLPTEPRHVTVGYYVSDCISLSGLGHRLGFHFRPQEDGQLRELEFFRYSYPDQAASFEEFQEHLVATFGPPQRESPGDQGLPNYGWTIGTATIQHYVFVRFGPEEHVRITRR